MDEIEQVLRRLRRIEELRAGAGGRPALLAELRALLVDGEAWLAHERRSLGEASAQESAAALDGLRRALAAHAPDPVETRQRRGSAAVAPPLEGVMPT